MACGWSPPGCFDRSPTKRRRRTWLRIAASRRAANDDPASQTLGQHAAISRQQCDELVGLFEAELNHVHSAGQVFLPREAESGRRESGRQECLPTRLRELAARGQWRSGSHRRDSRLSPPAQAGAARSVLRCAARSTGSARYSPVRPAAAQQPVHPLHRPYVPPPPCAPSPAGRGLGRCAAKLHGGEQHPLGGNPGGDADRALFGGAGDQPSQYA